MVTGHQAVERWAALIRPMFPPHAELVLQPRLGELRYRWPPRHAVGIFIAPNAIEDYLEAQDNARQRADANLRAFIKDNLARRHAGDLGEFRIVVASIDFIPLH